MRFQKVIFKNVVKGAFEIAILYAILNQIA